MQDEHGNWLICCVKGCDEKPQSLGLCVNHWRLNVKYGSPVAHKIAPWRWLQLSYEERFWMNVRKEENCWLWHGAKDRDGYGVFKGEHDGIVYTKAHRYSFVIHKGPIVTGLSVCHTCDVPSCVNPAHLVVGSTAFNMADKMAKGRHVAKFGAAQPRAILTEEQARAILTDPRSHSQIAAEYGVAAQTISSLKTRVSWSHLGKEKGVKAKRISPRRGKSDKVTPEIVRTIRASTDRGVDLAARFGIKPQDVSDIRKRRSWAHIE
jgi:transposase